MSEQLPKRTTQAQAALEQLQKTFGPILQERDADFAALVERLTDVASEVQVTGTCVPVQLEGRLESGELFYFRARGETASLSLWRGEESVDKVSKERYWNPDASAEADRWDWLEAGWLEAVEVEVVFRELLAEACAKLPAA